MTCSARTAGCSRRRTATTWGRSSTPLPRRCACTRSRSSTNAFVCVAEHAPDEALGYLRRLYAIQPEEGTGGLTDRELAGEAPSAAAECILDGWFSDWVDEWTQRALDLGIRGTPTVVVDGRLYPGGFDPADFRAFVESTPVRTVGEPRPVTA